MKPLLWKEARELRFWLLAGLTVVAGLESLWFSPYWRRSMEGGWPEAFMPVALVVVAVALGVGQVARERHARTIDYLLVRPVSASLIVWAKFVSGSIVLAVMVTALVGLAFVNPQTSGDTALRAIREQTGFVRLTAILFPRYWLVYAASLFFSVLVDRTAKAAAGMVVVVFTLCGLLSWFYDVAPLSSFVYWVPFFDGAGGLAAVAHSRWLFCWTAGWCAAGACGVTAGAAWLLKRSSERYLANRGLAVVAAGIVLVAVTSARGAAVRLTDLKPAHTIAMEFGPYEQPGIVANDRMVAVTRDDSVRFIDFPGKFQEVKIPLWSTRTDWFDHWGAIDGDRVFLLGTRKMLPEDRQEVMIVRRSGAEELPLEGVLLHDGITSPVAVGRHLYLGITHNRQCSLRVYDVEAKLEVASLFLEQMRPPEKPSDDGQPAFFLTRRGSYLYASTPSALIAIDIQDAARPVVTGRLAVSGSPKYLYGFPKPTYWQGSRLFQVELWPQRLREFDVSDPAHPALRGVLTWHAGLLATEGGDRLYFPWQSGAMEAQAARDGVESRRYLHGAGLAKGIVAAGDWVYVVNAKGVEAYKVR